MKVEILGSGGAIATPRPGCTCRVCAQARSMGLPYSRGGPSLFVHGPNVLIDTPEEIGSLLNRAQISHIGACLYSHWHPDHTMGRRIWEMNFDWSSWPPHNRCTDIYLPEQVARDFRTHLGLWEHFEFFARRGIVRLIELRDGESFRLGDTRVTPLRLAERYVYAFLFERNGRRLFVAMDELHGWTPPEVLRGVDLAVMPMGLIDIHPVSGKRLIPSRHPSLAHEATFSETLEMIRALEPRHVIISHIDEPGSLDYDDLTGLADELQRDGLPISFAYDTMVVAA